MAMREWNPAKRMGNQLTIPANLSDEDLRRTLQPHDDIKVCHHTCKELKLI